MISYRLALHRPEAHLFQVTVSVPKPAAKQRFSLPVWIPGSYLVREFARHLSALQARQRGKLLSLSQVDKTTWEADCQPGVALELSYLVYAFDTSVRAAFLDARRGFFNGTSVFLRAEGLEAEPHELWLRELPPAGRWPRPCRRSRSTGGAGAATWPRTTTSWSTNPSSWVRSGVAISRPMVCRTSSS